MTKIKKTNKAKNKPIVYDDRIVNTTKNILNYLGEDVKREGLLETPKRVAKFWQEFLTQGHEPDFNLTVFKNEGTDQMIVQNDIPLYSFCEHHMLPFFGTACVAYIPDKKIIGLSKLARIVKFYASRFQTQERLTQQIGELIKKTLNPHGVGVITKATHLCMTMRGVQAQNSFTVCSYLDGDLREEPEARSEFLALSREKM